jgi:hypothetical protein
VDGDHPNTNGGTAYPPAAEEEIEARQVMNVRPITARDKKEADPEPPPLSHTESQELGV